MRAAIQPSTDARRNPAVDFGTNECLPALGQLDWLRKQASGGHMRQRHTRKRRLGGCFFGGHQSWFVIVHASPPVGLTMWTLLLGILRVNHNVHIYLVDAVGALF
jgi:hypothetical protein